jgi:hypothetical protein
MEEPTDAEILLEELALPCCVCLGCELFDHVADLCFEFGCLHRVILPISDMTAQDKLRAKPAICSADWT